MGLLKAASAPTPLANAAAPLPASVVTTPLGANRRTRLLAESAKRTAPLASTATPRGVLSISPLPSRNPADPLPTIVLTFQ